MLQLQDIRDLLKGNFLEDAMMMELDIPRTTDVAIAIAVNSENAIEAWKLLKSHIEQTQRYPVFATSVWGESIENWKQQVIGQDLFTRFYFDEEYKEALSPEEIIARADIYTQNDLEKFLRSKADEEYSYGLEERICWEIEEMKANFGIAPLEAEIKALGMKTIVELERYLLEWEQKNNLQPELNLDYPEYSEQIGTSLYALILLPNPHSWNAMAYLDWWDGNKNSFYLLKQWDKNFGSQLIFRDGFMLEFFVENKPSSILEAFEIAWQQKALAPDTLSDAGVSIRDHARALLQLDRWFLYARP